MVTFSQQAIVLSLFAAVIPQAWAQSASDGFEFYHFAVVDQSALSALEVRNGGK